jgi:hypothetical protein
LSRASQSFQKQSISAFWTACLLPQYYRFNARQQEINLTLSQLGNVGDLLGGVAVVVTLLFLAFQIRKQATEARLNATRELARSLIAQMISLAEDAEMCSIYLRGINDYDALPDTDRIRLSMHLHSTFRIYELAFLHASRTNVDKSYFASSEKTKYELLGFPGVQRWWERSSNLFESEFIAHIEKVIAQQLEERR